MGKNGTKNKLIDLNNHLFEQLERLNDSDLTGDQLNLEIERSRAMAMVSTKIIENARLALDAQKALGDLVNHLPSMIGIEHDEDKK
jgi:hypothetical protein